MIAEDHTDTLPDMLAYDLGLIEIDTAQDDHDLQAVELIVHGGTNTGAWQSWLDARYRCTSPRAAAFDYYGGRGITMCAAWQGSFVSFRQIMGDRPAGLTLDRINNDGGYTCGQCEDCTANGWPLNTRWATRLEQAHNRRPRRWKVRPVKETA